MRDHAHTLSDFRVPTLSIECEPCGRRGRYNIARLMEKYGDSSPSCGTCSPITAIVTFSGDKLDTRYRKGDNGWQAYGPPRAVTRPSPPR
jgi:hypothetical protein